jgi:membrane dipeptidase
VRRLLTTPPTASSSRKTTWFHDNRDFAGIAEGLRAAGFSAVDVAGVMGDNWRRFLGEALKPGA